MRLVALVLVMLVAVSSAADADSAQRRARAENRRAMSKYDAGDYEAALTSFKRAYDIFPEPKILFNVAQAHRKLEQWAPALDQYRAYLDALPNAPNRDAVLEIIAELEATLAAENQRTSPPPEPVPPVEPAPPPPSVPRDLSGPPRGTRWHRDKIAWTLAGTGVAATAAGIAFFVHAGNQKSDFATTPEAGRRDLKADIRRNQTIGAIGVAVGGALLTSAIIKFVLTERSAGEPSLSVAFDHHRVLLYGAF